MDEIHAMHAHAMVSVWPNMNQGTADYEEFAAAGWLLNDLATYDAFNPEARAMYWRQAKRELFDGGFDAWWCDSTEPFSGPDWGGATLREPWERFQLVGGEHKKFLDPEKANLYAVAHAKGIYENQRRDAPDRRVLNLTRSGYVSSQRYGAVLWSGDISARWDVMKKQIAEALNMAASGYPWWTLDIGGFFVVRDNWRARGCGCDTDPSPKWFWRGDFEDGVNDPGYRELYVRWLQFGCFLPMFRSHGTDTPREIWNFGSPGEPFYDAIAETIRLRYRLMPYIYSLAGGVWRDNGMMVRPLLFDFPEDRRAVAERHGVHVRSRVPGVPGDAADVLRPRQRAADGGEDLGLLPARGLRLVRLLDRRALSPAARRSPWTRRLTACRCSCGRAPSSPWSRACNTPTRSPTAPWRCGSIPARTPTSTSMRTPATATATKRANTPSPACNGTTRKKPSRRGGRIW